MLHITNGDIAVERMRDGGLRGEYLPWHDVLHEGPVPVTATLQELSAIRARYLAGCDYAEEALIAGQFSSRTASASGAGRFGVRFPAPEVDARRARSLGEPQGRG